MLEMENNAGGNAEIVLRLAASCCFREAREQVLHLRGPERQTMEEFHVNAAAERRSKRVAGAAGAESAAARMRDTEKSLRKRSDAFMTPVRKARTKKVGGKRAVDTSTENIVGMVAAEI